jgi:hypothetical protein
MHSGAYQSLIKVDFKALDSYSIKPLGVYGSKKEVMAFLISIGAIDADTYGFYFPPYTILIQFSGTSIPDNPSICLHSGLYIVMPQNVSDAFYVFYWPEDTTWDDNATSTVQRNRVAFMR